MERLDRRQSWSDSRSPFSQYWLVEEVALAAIVVLAGCSFEILVFCFLHARSLTGSNEDRQFFAALAGRSIGNRLIHGKQIEPTCLMKIHNRTSQSRETWKGEPESRPSGARVQLKRRDGHTNE